MIRDETLVPSRGFSMFVVVASVAAIAVAFFAMFPVLPLGSWPARTDDARLGGRWETLARGLRYRVVSVADGAGESVNPGQSLVQMHQVLLDPRQVELRVLYTGDAVPVASAAAQAGALAAVNASYFDTERRPLGYLRIDGTVVNAGVANGAAFTGVFTMRGGAARIVSRDAFNGHGVDMALQAGPRLVVHGEPTKGLRETRAFRQSGIAVTRRGDVVIYASDAMTWRRMQGLLTGSSQTGGIDARDVLNLDGGSSSQIYVRRSDGSEVTSGFPTNVPVALAVFARR